jgi:hypothetical protein
MRREEWEYHMVELTPEQQRAVDAANGNPPQFVDRRTQEVYVLVRVAVFDQLTRGSAPAPVWEVPEGIRRSKAALRRDLPALLANPRNRGRWVCYFGDERIGIGDYASLMRECNRRELRDDEFVIKRISPGAGSEEEEEVDRTFIEIDEELA